MRLSVMYLDSNMCPHYKHQYACESCEGCFLYRDPEDFIYEEFCDLMFDEFIEAVWEQGYISGCFSMGKVAEFALEKDEVIVFEDGKFIVKGGAWWK